MDLNKLLQLVIDKQASDLHLIPGYYPTIRVAGELHQLTTLTMITPSMVEQMVLPPLNGEQRENFLANKELDLAITYNDNRFRVNLYYAKGVICGSFRLIPAKIR